MAVVHKCRASLSLAFYGRLADDLESPLIMDARIRNHLVKNATPRMRLRRSWPSRRIGTNQKEIGMSRVLHVTFVLSAFTGLVLAQGPPPAAVNAPVTAPGPGRPGLTPVVIGPPAPVPHEVAIPRTTPA